ncbi:MAG: transketolase C-terminal domain-containing protein, partial [Bellilinea sp.]
GRERRFLSSIYLDPPQEEQANLRMLRRWQEVVANEVRYKSYFMDDAKFAVVGFGSTGRVALSAVRTARAEGIPVGLIRPITLNPFPEQVVAEAAKQVDGMLVVEMNMGQMLDDVLRISKGQTPVEFYGRPGGIMPLPDEILNEIHRMAEGPLPLDGNPRVRWLDRMTGLN